MTISSGGIHRQAVHRLWLTRLPLRGQRLLLHPIVSYSIADRMTADPAYSTLRNAIALRDPEGIVVHFDCARHFPSRDVREALACNG
jgi:hypothetical protein